MRVRVRVRVRVVVRVRVCHTGLQPRTSGQGPRQVCYSLADRRQVCYSHV